MESPSRKNKGCQRILFPEKDAIRQKVECQKNFIERKMRKKKKEEKLLEREMRIEKKMQVFLEVAKLKRRSAPITPPPLRRRRHRAPERPGTKVDSSNRVVNRNMLDLLAEDGAPLWSPTKEVQWHNRLRHDHVHWPSPTKHEDAPASPDGTPLNKVPVIIPLERM